MWVATTRGFYSAVQKPTDSYDQLTIRARNLGDIERLAELIPDARGGITHGGGTDYPYRLRCTKSEWEDALKIMASEIDYANFKDEVKRTRGAHVAEVYSRVWTVLLSLEDRATRRPRRAPRAAAGDPSSKR